MFARRGSRYATALAAVMLLTSTCALEAPVSVSDRPLAERIAGEESDANEGDIQPVVVSDGLAFADEFDAMELLRVRLIDDDVITPLRSGPGSGFDQLAEVPSGAEVLATGNQTGEWVHVLYADFDGWIMAARARRPQSDGTSQVVDAAEAQSKPVEYVVVGEAIGVNIRAEPDAGSELVSGAPVGASVVGTGETEGAWIEVSYGGVTGWASGNYLEPAGASEAVPSGDD